MRRRRNADRSGKGLRHFSMKVCKKVEEKGKTTYNEVADELVAEVNQPVRFFIFFDYRINVFAFVCRKQRVNPWIHRAMIKKIYADAYMMR